MAQEELERWILETARDHMLKDPSTEDNVAGVIVRHEPKAAHL